MIRRYVLHLEWHRGYRPRISLRRAPRHGQRIVDGGEPGKLARCVVCQDGFLFERDVVLRPSAEPRAQACDRCIPGAGGHPVDVRTYRHAEPCIHVQRGTYG